MLDVNFKHDFEVKKLAIGGIAIGVAVGVSSAITKEVISVTKNKIKQLKDKKK